MDPRIITILDDEQNPIFVNQNEPVKLINPDGKDIGSFHILGKLVARPDEAGTVVLADVPHEGETIVIDVNNKAGQMTYISNATLGHTFIVDHPDIAKKDSTFKPFHDETVKPRPFTVTWSFYSVEEDCDKTVTIEFRPLPAEHALLMKYTIS